jgi:hypothetical protein
MGRGEGGTGTVETTAEKDPQIRDTVQVKEGKGHLNKNRWRIITENSEKKRTTLKEGIKQMQIVQN